MDLSSLEKNEFVLVLKNKMADLCTESLNKINQEEHRRECVRASGREGERRM